jgi:signal transduction histidine kinase
MQRWSTQIKSQPKSTIVGLGLILVGGLGGIDLITGSELSFSIFYLIPIAMVAWLVGWRSSIVISVAATASWLVADWLTTQSYSHASIPFWNAAVRMGFFQIVSYALARLHDSRIRQEELGDFIVHDLRSPLGIVVTGLHALQGFDSENLTTKQQEVITLCLSSTDRMLILINSLLDLKRLESGQMPLDRTEIAVAKLLQSSVKPLRLWAAERQIAISWALDPPDIKVFADPLISERILVNLVSNAIKFSPKETTVTIQVKPHAPNAVAFGVSDQGHGIPPEWAQRVFDKFAQVDFKKAGSREGSGLGLSFCRLAVEAQGGRIWVERGVAQGTTITFTLPANLS